MEGHIHPQVARSRAAVLAAVVDLIEREGGGAVTHQRVAEQAGVGRATVYRHWPNRLDLMLDALAQADLRFFAPGAGPFATWVRVELLRVARELNAPGLTSLAVTIVERSQWDEATRELRDRLLAATEANLAEAIERARAAGELGPDRLESSTLFAQLVGPLWARRTLQDIEIDDAFVDRVIDDVVGPHLVDAS
jgi:AcrR family transcriptional regulator